MEVRVQSISGLPTDDDYGNLPSVIALQSIQVWRHDFPVYWNIPTFQCASYEIYFKNIAKRYNFIQNKNDSFHGDKLVILYDPGNFPAILNLKGTTKYLLRNNGVPQEGNLTLHLHLFTKKLEELIPDRNFNGIAIIDFESWRPIFRQNFGTLAAYKELSIDIERRRHPMWPDTLLRKQAIKRFEAAGKIYMERTLMIAHQQRPYAQWGYYGYPYCFNMRQPGFIRECSLEIRQENDRLAWLFEDSNILYPSLYLSENSLEQSDRMKLIEGRIIETERITNRMMNTPKILPYIWFKYQDTKNYLSEVDMQRTLNILSASKVDGVIIWGSSKDVNSKQNCEHLLSYINKTLGPVTNSQ